VSTLPAYDRVLTDFTDAWKRATALPGEPHWDEDLSIPCERIPTDVIGWNDPIPDMEPAR
jgi:hypothetical protein